MVDHQPTDVGFLHPEGRVWLAHHLYMDHHHVGQRHDAHLVVAHEMAHGVTKHREAFTEQIIYKGLADTPHDAIRLLQVHQGGHYLQEIWPRVRDIEERY